MALKQQAPPAGSNGEASETSEAASGPPAEDRSGPAFDLRALRAAAMDDLLKLDVCVQRDRFLAELRAGALDHASGPVSAASLAEAGMGKEQVMAVIEAGMASMQSYVQARMAAALGHCFYTIGPGGEEFAAVMGMALRPTDGMALHYRHVAAQVARQRAAGRSMEEVLLDRARGHCVSVNDPVCGGAHCAIGGGDFDFVVTSTLASQTPPAVGRALGNTLAHACGVPGLLLPKDAVNFVSLGDGSVNNGHFLSAVNLAKYAKHRKNKVPVVFCITDNGLSISHKGQGFLQTVLAEGMQMPTFQADTNSLADVWTQTHAAVEQSRKTRSPVTLIIKNVPRRFGHASTDRQAAYLTKDEIAGHANRNPLAGACAQAVAEGFTTWGELADMFEGLGELNERAFEAAVREPNIKNLSRENMLERLSPPRVEPAPAASLAPLHWGGSPLQWTAACPAPGAPAAKGKGRDVMRKHMTRTFDEAMGANPDMVYLGEDVEHGGYYLVTDKLAAKHAPRVMDFPPDETTLLGAAAGFAQVGLLPVVEIPYAKYLDCGFDMFTELIISHWLSNGRRHNGMVIRLQGFGTGVFGGNFHTHNTLYIPPGLDVVCYSNGQDYARGFRYSLEQARKGRVVMMVDSTYLLNLRHVFEGDDAWRLPMPEEEETMSWDVVRRYGEGSTLALVTYGEGVIRCLQAKAALEEQGVEGVVVIDNPLLSGVPAGLEEAIGEFDHVVFADVCKAGQHPFGGFITELQARGALPPNWQCVSACPTYNPLGCTVTFLSEEDVVGAAFKAMGR